MKRQEQRSWVRSALRLMEKRKRSTPRRASPSSRGRWRQCRTESSWAGPARTDPDSAATDRTGWQCIRSCTCQRRHALLKRRETSALGPGAEEERLPSVSEVVFSRSADAGLARRRHRRCVCVLSTAPAIPPARSSASRSFWGKKVRVLVGVCVRGERDIVLRRGEEKGSGGSLFLLLMCHVFSWTARSLVSAFQVVLRT